MIPPSPERLFSKSESRSTVRRRQSPLGPATLLNGVGRSDAQTQVHTPKGFTSRIARNGQIKGRPTFFAPRKLQPPRQPRWPDNIPGERRPTNPDCSVGRLPLGWVAFNKEPRRADAAPLALSHGGRRRAARLCCGKDFPCIAGLVKSSSPFY